MTNESDAVPPPYSSEDPLRVPIPQPDVTVYRTYVPPFNAHSQGIRSYEHAVGEDEALSSASAVQYFEEHPAPSHRPRSDTLWHTIHLNPQSEVRDVAFLPMCWQIASSYITEADMSTFANYLFPQSPSRILTHDKHWEEVQGKSESWYRHTARPERTVAEWNEGFFEPRGLHITLIHENDNRTPYSPMDVGCAECTAAYQMASEYPSIRQDNTTMGEATRRAENPDMSAWYPPFSRRCHMEPIAGSTTPALSHQANHRSRYTNKSCHSGRQQNGCKSRRQRCGQKTFEPAISTLSSNDNAVIANASILIAGMEMLALANPTTVTTGEDHPISPAPKGTNPNKNTPSDFSLIRVPPRTREDAKNEIRSLKEVKADLKSLSQELKATMKQAKAERKEELKALKGGRKALKRDIKAAWKERY